MKSFLERLVGRLDYWPPQRSAPFGVRPQERGVAPSCMVLGHTLSIPVRNGELMLGMAVHHFGRVMARANAPCMCRSWAFPRSPRRRPLGPLCCSAALRKALRRATGSLLKISSSSDGCFRVTFSVRRMPRERKSFRMACRFLVNPPEFFRPGASLENRQAILKDFALTRHSSDAESYAEATVRR